VIGCWIVAAFLGNAWTAASTLSLHRDDGTDVQFHDVEYRDESFVSPIYYGGRVGACHPSISWLSVEAEFIHLKTIADAGRLSEPMPRFELSHGLNQLLFNVAARRHPFVVRGGVGPTVPHVETVVDGQRVDEYQLGSVAWHLSVGTEFPVWSGLFAIGEFKWTATHERLEVPGGHVSAPFTTAHVVFGLEWRRR
jgi:hypothetical protein